MIDRRQILEKGKDSTDLPMVCHNTLVECFWNEREIGGVRRSVIHPDIKSLIVDEFLLIHL